MYPLVFFSPTRKMASRVKVYFPDRTLTVQPKGNFITTKGTITFITPVNQTKYEIKQYVKKIYGLDVIKVNTIIYDGKMKRDGARKLFKQKAYKKAIVTVDNTYFLEKQFQQQLAAQNQNDKE